jgi:DNA-binding GntR family transcriptional regulator
MITNRDELVQKLGIEKSSKENQDIILNNLASTVNGAILSKITEKLSDADLDQLDKLIDEGDEGSVEWFIKSRFEHYDNFAEQIENEVIEEIINNNQALKANYYNAEGPSGSLNL